MIAVTRHLTRLLDRALFPAVTDASAWCEARAFRVERCVERSPLASVLVVLLGGFAIGAALAPRRRR